MSLVYGADVLYPCSHCVYPCCNSPSERRWKCSVAVPCFPAVVFSLSPTPHYNRGTLVGVKGKGEETEEWRKGMRERGWNPCLNNRVRESFQAGELPSVPVFLGFSEIQMRLVMLPGFQKTILTVLRLTKQLSCCIHSSLTSLAACSPSKQTRRRLCVWVCFWISHLHKDPF